MANARVQEISIPHPEEGDLSLRITVGACRVTVSVADADLWVSGSYRDPSGRIPCVVTREGGAVRISQGRGVADFVGLIEGLPTLDLRLGRARSCAFTFESGAGEATLDLGGAPITRAVIRQGAGKCDIDFSSPNEQAMSMLDLSAGAGVVNAKNLANANAAEMVVEGGAGSFKLDFGGTLQRDANVRISAGMSSVEVVIPAATAAKVTSQTVLGSVDSGDAFSQREGSLWNQAAVADSTPVIAIRSNLAMGLLRLRAS